VVGFNGLNAFLDGINPNNLLVIVRKDTNEKISFY
jgi:hypothetical protein